MQVKKLLGTLSEDQLTHFPILEEYMSAQVALIAWPILMVGTNIAGSKMTQW